MCKENVVICFEVPSQNLSESIAQDDRTLGQKPDGPSLIQSNAAADPPVTSSTSF